MKVIINCNELMDILEQFEDTKGAIKIRTSKKNRQHNGQKKKYKNTNNDLQNIHERISLQGKKCKKFNFSVSKPE
jgi:hypothetical protein